MPDEAPYRNFNFLVRVDGLPETGFTQVVIPGSRIEIVEYRTGADGRSASRKLPGRASTGNVVLRRGMDQDLAFWTWFAEVRDGSFTRRDVVIALLDDEGNVVLRWRVGRAWPAAYESSLLDAQGNEVLIETMELACESVDIVT
jgi:phage tail-like protein